MDIKDIIKRRRKELGLTMLDVAKACDVSEATVSRWESGNIGDMKRSRIASLAKILNISPSIIVGTDEEAENQDPFDGLYGDHRANLEYFADKPDLLALYKDLTDNNNLRILFDSAKDLTPQDLEPVLILIKGIRQEKGLD